MIRIFAFILLLAASPAFAALTCPSDPNKVNPQGVLGGDASAYMQGCLQEPTGLIDNPGTTAWNGAYIAWRITPTLDGNLFYEYTWSGVMKDVSHIILGLSTDCTVGTACLWDISWSKVEYNTWGPSSSNPGFPSGASFYGIKFDGTTGTTFNFSFKSNRVPVWQNFYAKDGTDKVGDVHYDVYAYNAGLGKTGPSYYVAAPDTVIPEPGFYGLLALGLAGLYLAARRRSIAK